VQAWQLAGYVYRATVLAFFGSLGLLPHFLVGTLVLGGAVILGFTVHVGLIVFGVLEPSEKSR
jgi:hypothetical protein